ncbi:DNA recombination-mediator protein A [compost metagenome]
MKTYAFTGHRPDKLGGYSTTNNPIYDKVKDWLEFTVEYLVRRHEDVTFISGGALGVDQMAAEAVLKIKAKYAGGVLVDKDGTLQSFKPQIRLMLALPCRGYDGKWPENSRRMYASILRQADTHVYVHDGPYPGAWCLQKRNEYMVDQADGVIAVFNGDKDGGTRNCMLYAWKVHKPILQLDIKHWQEVRHVRPPKKK